MPKKHWTQTLEGKKKLSKRMKRVWQQKKVSAKRTKVRKFQHGSSEEVKVAYAFGRVEGFIVQFSEGSGVSGQYLTERLGELLLTKARR